MEAAIYQDCYNLIEEFINEGSPSFQIFCNKWHKLMFQYMYTAQSSSVELMQTTLAIFHVAKRTVCAKDEFGKYLSATEGNEEQDILRRICGIYLMYGIYFKQPTKQYIKVSVSLETWKEMTTFIESLKENPKMMAARYMFWRLYQADAFRFTALDYPVGLEGLADYDKINEEHQEIEQTEVVRVKAKHKLISIPEIQETLNEMKEQEQKYNELKSEIAKSQNQAAEALPPTKIFHKMHSVFANIKGILDEKPAEDGASSKSIGTKKKEIKRKAAGIRNRSYEPSESSSNESSSSEISGESYRAPIPRVERKAKDIRKRYKSPAKDGASSKSIGTKKKETKRKAAGIASNNYEPSESSSNESCSSAISEENYRAPIPRVERKVKDIRKRNKSPDRLKENATSEDVEEDDSDEDYEPSED
uniref:snRNA-activating protein complex subunit 1 n=1 Tax=Stomoxys calcitrans TaxID=35570 RepID=A0A1I8P7X4_STOCA